MQEERTFFLWFVSLNHTNNTTNQWNNFNNRQVVRDEDPQASYKFDHLSWKLDQVSTGKVVSPPSSEYKYLSNNQNTRSTTKSASGLRCRSQCYGLCNLSSHTQATPTAKHQCKVKAIWLQTATS